MIFYFGHRWFLAGISANLPLILLEGPGLLNVFINHSKLYFTQNWGYRNCGFLWFVLGSAPIPER